MKKIISTERAPKAIGPYSQAVISNGWAFLSGQIPLDPATNQIVAGDIAAQTERVLENLEERAGSGRVVTGAGGQDHRVLKGHGRVREDERGLWAVFREQRAGPGYGGSGAAAARRVR